MPSGRIRITPHLRPEPDLDALVVAVMLMLDDIEAETSSPTGTGPAAPPTSPTDQERGEQC